MRKVFMSALLAVTLATGAFAAEKNKGNYFAQHSFESQFKNASNVEWSTGKGYTKATFALDNERMEAFYSPYGDLIGTSRTVNIDKLRVNAKRTFTKKLEGYTIKEAIRFEGTDESAYYISAENEKGSVIVKIEDNGFVIVKKA